MMMKRAVADNPGCDGIVLGGHGLFTWGETQRECYLSTITVIDQIGQFIARHGEKKGPVRFGGEALTSREDRKDLAVQIAPFLRGRVSSKNAFIANFSDGADVLQFVNSAMRRSWHFWARVARITLSAPRFGRCLCPGPGTAWRR